MQQIAKINLIFNEGAIIVGFDTGFCNFYICLLVFHVKYMTDVEILLEGKVLDVLKVWFDKHRRGILDLLYIMLLGPK